MTDTGSVSVVFPDDETELTMVEGVPVGYEALVRIRSGSRWEYVISTNLPPKEQKSVDSYASAEMAVNALDRDLPNLIVQP